LPTGSLESCERSVQVFALHPRDVGIEISFGHTASHSLLHSSNCRKPSASIDSTVLKPVPRPLTPFLPPENHPPASTAVQSPGFAQKESRISSEIRALVTQN